ncbi:hypothetical protein [Hyphomonas sp. KY3]|uniref:oxidoreductase n=1 Tax=Hyphomonas sp. KY3 TaxID=2016196 RepID=UPI001A9081A0|nr:hypothetical protein [Hyphomonas sp. KY3]
MVPWRATEGGEVSQDVIDWYTRFAEGKPGAIVVEATGIQDVPSGPLLRIGHDRFLPGLKALTQAVKVASEGHTRLYIQLIDFLQIKRRPSADTFIDRFLPISDELRNRLGALGKDDEQVKAQLKQLSVDELEVLLTPRDFESMTRGFRERVTDTHLPHIAELPERLPPLFAQAALRAEEAGFDGVELHYAHAYTMASFLSALNTRSDGFGGSRANRVRLPINVFEAVRSAVSDQFIVGCRMLSDECITDGSGQEDARWFAQEFARAGMDFISLSRGGKFEDAKEPKVGEAIYPYTGQSGYECMPQIISDEAGPFGRNEAASISLRSHLRGLELETPIIVAGGIHSFEQAERILKQEIGDFAALARQALADPDWFEKVRSGKGSQVRICEYTNYCEGLDQKHKMVTCQLWDREDLETDSLRLTPDGKRRTTAPKWVSNSAQASGQKT